MSKVGIAKPARGRIIEDIILIMIDPRAPSQVTKLHHKEAPLLIYACSIEAVTTQKKNNSILDVDGCIGFLLVDRLKELKFSHAEIDQMIGVGTFQCAVPTTAARLTSCPLPRLEAAQALLPPARPHPLRRTEGSLTGYEKTGRLCSSNETACHVRFSSTTRGS